MESISNYMQEDHVLIDGIAERAAAAAAAGDLAAMERDGTLFLQRLERHIEMEENLLFPAFEERTGMTAAGPSVTMREEHVQMKEIFPQIRSAIEAKDAAAYQRAMQALTEMLMPHNMKEEQMMYPMLDDAMGSDAAGLLAEVKEMAT